MAAYDPIQARFNDVIRDFKHKLNNDKLYNEIRNFTSAEDVYQTTDKLQAEQGKSGHLRNLSKIGPFLERMQEYSEAIKIFVQVKPDILALVWGPIRLLLQWTSVLKQSFDAIINTTGEIGDLLPEFLEVTKLFDQNAHLKDVLVLFFQDILDFYLVTLQFFSASRWKYVFEAIWPRQRDKLKLVMAHIGRHALLLRNEVRLEHIREEHQARLSALAHFEKSERANIRQEHESIRTSINPKSYDHNLDWYHGRVCDGTNQWVMNDPSFAKWLDHNDDTTRSIWLKGIPGSGKTFLAGAVIDKAKSLGRTMFAFLSHAYESNTTALSVLHSLIFQLTLGDLDLQGILCQTSKKNIGSNLQVAATLLSTLLSSLDTAYIIIDGLDEINKIERGRLLTHMIEVSKTCVKVRIAVASRAESDVVARIDSCFSSIQVNDHNTGSIQAFVTKKTKDFLDSRDFLEEENAEIEALLAPISAKAKGMFLYAKILLDCIEPLFDVDSIRAELRVLPQDLDDAYNHILSRINKSRSTVAREYARQVLGWIGCSPTPLTVREIEQALVVRPCYETTMTPVKASLNLVELCGPIVEVENGYARFVHFTVREYFFDNGIVGHIDLTEASLDLTNRCIYYLCTDHFDELLTPEEIEQHLLQGHYRLHYYAVTYWFELVTQCLALQRSDQPPSTLNTALEILISLRSHYDFSDFPLSADQVKRPELDGFDKYNVHVTQMLRHVARFDKQLSGSAVHLDHIDDWKWPAPLTTVQTARQIYKTMNAMLCQERKNGSDRSFTILERHYGSNLFKCGYLDCPKFRQGFSQSAARKSHETLHVKPWKCNELSCEYSEIGFISQTMRDAHNCVNDQVQRPQTDLSSELQGKDDIPAVIIDLIQLDKVSEVEVLLTHLKSLDYKPYMEVAKAAIDYGSNAIIDIVLKPSLVRGESISALLAYSIKIGNLHALHLLKPHTEWFSYGFWLRRFISAMIVSESFEARQACENLLLNEILLLHNAGASRLKYSDCIREAALHPDVLAQTCGLRDREHRLISFWTTLSTRGHFNLTRGTYNKQALHIVASLSSISMAKMLLKSGVDVNNRRSTSYPTPLQRAAYRDSEKCARMMEFLLYHGADPKARAQRTGRAISDEKGAKEISKWLNMSWEELVAKVEADRARGYCPLEYRLDSDEC